MLCQNVKATSHYTIPPATHSRMLHFIQKRYLLYFADNFLHTYLRACTECTAHEKSQTQRCRKIGRYTFKSTFGKCVILRFKKITVNRVESFWRECWLKREKQHCVNLCRRCCLSWYVLLLKLLPQQFLYKKLSESPAKIFRLCPIYCSTNKL